MIYRGYEVKQVADDKYEVRLNGEVVFEARTEDGALMKIDNHLRAVRASLKKS